MKEQGSSNEKTTPEQFLVLPLAFSFRDFLHLSSLGVGNPAALERRRLMLVGKERLANSHPPFVPVRPKGQAGT
jgi:hypothetical protein